MLIKNIKTEADAIVLLKEIRKDYEYSLIDGGDGFVLVSFNKDKNKLTYDTGRLNGIIATLANLFHILEDDMNE